jgi:DNA-directed RNA polymerase subunit N (RpoN/RPB10)
MIIPVRCFSCGKVSKSTPTPQPKESTTDFHAKQVVGNLWAQYLKSIEEGFPNADDMDKERYAIHLLYHPHSLSQKERKKKKEGMLRRLTTRVLFVDDDDNDDE